MTFDGDAWLARIYEAMSALGVRCPVMGGHAVRPYGVDRATMDYDLHVVVSWRATQSEAAAKEPM